MTAALSDYLKLKLLDHSLGHASFTMPATPYIALYTTDPTAADVGVEVTGGGYARQPLVTGAAAAGQSSNSTSVSFLPMPTTAITHVGIRTAATGAPGYLLWYAPLTVPKATTSGDTLTIDIGSLVFTLA